MILGTGVDIIEIRRIARLIERGSPLDRIFTEAEIRVCREEGFSAARTASRLAGLFAAKEAVMKALGTGWTRGVAFSDIRTTHTPSGRPEVSLKGRTAEIAASMGVWKVHVSISHDRTHAVAFAVLEGFPGDAI
jgi:holo-[acyl-carrier protein] synthase